MRNPDKYLKEYTGCENTCECGCNFHEAIKTAQKEAYAHGFYTALFVCVLFVLICLLSSCTLYNVTIKTENGCYTRSVKYRFFEHKPDSVFISNRNKIYVIR